MMLSATFNLILCLISIPFTVGIEYHITSSELSERCIVGPCLSLTQFANNTSEYLNSNTTLILEPGNYILTSQITVSGVTSFSIVPYSSLVTLDTNIVCESIGSLDVRNVSHVSIIAITFIGCVKSRLLSVQHLSIENSSFFGHENVSGRALQIVNTKGSIVDTLFAEMNNSTNSENGAIQLTRSNVTIVKCVFREIVSTNGAILCEEHSNLNILKSILSMSHSVEQQTCCVGVLYLKSKCKVTVHDSLFHGDQTMLSLDYAVTAHNADSLTINTSMFRDIYNCRNVLFANSTEIIISTSIFVNNNRAHIDILESGCEVFADINLASILIKNSHFITNYGGVLKLTNSIVNITQSNFFNNTKLRDGGAVQAFQSTININQCKFYGNKVLKHYNSGGAVFLKEGNSTIENSTFMGNVAGSGGAIYLSGVKNNNYQVVISGCNFSKNIASKFGGAISAVFNLESARHHNSHLVIFQQTVILTNNYAGEYFGGAMHLNSISTGYNFQAIVVGNLIITNNTIGERNGGGIYLHLVSLTIQKNSTLELSYNGANENGGGIYAEFSIINVNFSSDGDSPIQTTPSLLFQSNQAKNGGGLYLCNSQVYVYSSTNDGIKDAAVKFIANSASFGGALYLAMEDTCVSIAGQISQCFLQTRSISAHGQMQRNAFDRHNAHKFDFSQNHAEISGSSIFREEFKYCTMDEQKLLEITSLTIVSDLKISSVSSFSVQVCFCLYSQPDCSLQNNYIKVINGKEFIIEAAIADRGNHLVNGSVINQIESGLIQENQRIQDTSGKCTKLKFTVFSTQSYQILKMVPVISSPYIITNLSSQAITLEFPFCISCPIGFEKGVHKVTGCDCICDTHLAPYIVACDASTQVLTKGRTTAWVGYVNHTVGTSGYLVYPYCPYRYCLPPDELVDINLNIPEGADAQCSHNRSGILCGRCAQGLSLSLGSSNCIPCPYNWKGFLVAIIFGQLFAGVLLVIVILSLNLTVAMGTLNGIIFYANIVAANTSTFFPSSSVLTVFLAWLNLELGIDVCFFEGMDAYWKVCIQLAFPTLILILVILVIVMSERYVVVARLMGKKNPVATLDTLILLSYVKFLRIIIASYSFAIVDYPDGSYGILWLPDATVMYFSGKHVVLLIVATLILSVGIAYTALLFSWQWMLLHQRRKIFRWVRHQRLSLFIEPYHAPYNFKHRYWTGLLLLVRVVLYIVSAMNVTGDPGLILLTTGVCVSCLIIYKALLRNDRGIYKKWPVEFLEIVCYVNIVWFCFARYYTRERERGQFIVACISGSITFVLFLAVVTYHLVIEFFFKTNTFKKIKIKMSMKRLNPCGNASDGLTVNLLSPLEVNSPTHTEIRLSALVNNSTNCNTKCTELSGSEIDKSRDNITENSPE